MAEWPVLDVAAALAYWMRESGSLPSLPQTRPASAPSEKRRRSAEQFVEPDGWVIYTDGSIRRKLGYGGFGLVVVRDHVIVHELGHRAANTTSNRMEIGAVLWAMQYMVEYGVPDAVIFSDSEYTVLSATKWLTGWRRKGWKTANGDPVKNQDLWERVHAMLSVLGSHVKLQWVSGHCGTPGNERADTIANAFADGVPIERVCPCLTSS